MSLSSSGLSPLMHPWDPRPSALTAPLLKSTFPFSLMPRTLEVTNFMTFNEDDDDDEDFPLFTLNPDSVNPLDQFKTILEDEKQANPIVPVSEKQTKDKPKPLTLITVDSKDITPKATSAELPVKIQSDNVAIVQPLVASLTTKPHDAHIAEPSGIKQPIAGVSEPQHLVQVELTDHSVTAKKPPPSSLAVPSANNVGVVKYKSIWEDPKTLSYLSEVFDARELENMLKLELLPQEDGELSSGIAGVQDIKFDQHVKNLLSLLEPKTQTTSGKTHQENVNLAQLQKPAVHVQQLSHVNLQQPKVKVQQPILKLQQPKVKVQQPKLKVQQPKLSDPIDPIWISAIANNLLDLDDGEIELLLALDSNQQKSALKPNNANLKGKSTKTQLPKQSTSKQQSSNQAQQDELNLWQEILDLYTTGLISDDDVEELLVYLPITNPTISRTTPKSNQQQHQQLQYSNTRSKAYLDAYLNDDFLDNDDFLNAYLGISNRQSGMTNNFGATAPSRSFTRSPHHRRTQQSHWYNNLQYPWLYGDNTFGFDDDNLFNYQYLLPQYNFQNDLQSRPPRVVRQWVPHARNFDSYDDDGFRYLNVYNMQPTFVMSGKQHKKDSISTESLRISKPRVIKSLVRSDSY